MFNDQDIIDARGKLLALDRSQAVIQFSLTGHVVDANERFLRLFEYQLEEILGRHHSLFCEPDYVASLEYGTLWEKLARGERDAGQYKRIARSGRPIWIQSSYNPILDLQGRPLRVIKFATDISEQKEAEQALSDALRSRQVFLSTMSHELRTPMNVIIGLGQLLIDDPDLRADHRDQIDDIVRAGGHLLSLINDVLDLSQVESGLTTLRLTRVQSDRIVEEAVDMLGVLAKGRSISLSADDPCPVIVKADPFRLKQVLVNLLSNAVKYNRPGGSVRVTRATREQTLRVSVQDTGFGIPAARLHELFQPFNRLGAEQTEIEGTGIGLSICKRMVEAMDGKIGVESVEGQGSCFWIELPILESGSAERNQTSNLSGPRRREAQPTDRRYRILVAEDHIVNQKLIRRQLEMLGYDCLVTANGAEALAAFERESFDLLLSDLNMPVLDGYSLAKSLRGLGHSSEQLPIVFLTADVFNADQSLWRESGGDAYLTKPTQLDALSSCLRTLLRPSDLGEDEPDQETTEAEENEGQHASQP